MGLLDTNIWWRTRPSNVSAGYLPFGNYDITCGKFTGLCDAPSFTPTGLCRELRVNVRAFASPNSAKKSRILGIAPKNVPAEPNKPPDGSDGLSTRPSSRENDCQDNNEAPPSNKLDEQNLISVPSRGAVLQACTVTSAVIAALGVIIREVLTSLQPLDYVVVAFLSGFSEELLFRGALLPLFGINWNSILVVSALFGVLYLGSGRKYSFAVWATFVGLAYGYATIVSSSIVVPMISHALNNLVGGIMWRYTSNSSK